VDRDGRVDLVVAGRGAAGLAVLLNRTGDPPANFTYPAVDIEPGECPNRWDVQASGFLRVALLGGTSIPGYGMLDPATVLPDSVRLEGVPALRATARIHDASGTAEACGVPCQCTARAPDGVADAMFMFDAQAVAVRLGAMRDGETRLLHFEARLAGGRVINAEDCVVIAAPASASTKGSIPDPGHAEVVGPNPVEPGAGTAVRYEVPEGGAMVRIGIYSVAGRRVATLIHGFQPAGERATAWDGRDETGRPTTAGVYFVRSEIDGVRSVLRIVIAP
jgi:hypothetical protein